MKRIIFSARRALGILTALLFATTSAALAQYLNLQQHMDFGKNRHYFTTTLEGLAVDSWGSWFGFIDVDHSSKTSGTADTDWHPGAQLIYFEINRYFSLQGLSKSAFLQRWDFTVQYNDADVDYIPTAYLIGLSCNRILGDICDVHLEFLLRQEEKQKLGWQFTGVWFKEFRLSGWRWRLCGYFDWWKNDFGRFWMAEPQILCSLEKLGIGQRFWLGSEWEINIGPEDADDSVNPTLFVQYDF